VNAHMFFLLVVFVFVVVSANDRPIIGVFTQATESTLVPFGKSYIAASYVKWLESAGARVVPIFHTATQVELKAVFNSINGIFFPGGAADLTPSSPLFRSAFFMYQLALNANDNGDFFPIQGHCLGFELLHLMTSRNASLLGSVDAEDIAMPLDFTGKAAQSRMFSKAPSKIIDILKKQPVTMNFHQFSVFPVDYTLNPSLDQFYQILSTNVDRKNKTFISSVEGKHYPVYALQWHAEKPQFEWDPSTSIPHTSDALLAMQYMTNFFVSEARKSQHKFVDVQSEAKALIYNYPVSYTGLKIEPHFQECYFFDR